MIRSMIQSMYLMYYNIKSNTHTMSDAYYRKCKRDPTIKELIQSKDFKSLPDDLKRKAKRLTKKELCKLLAVAKEANKEGDVKEFVSLVKITSFGPPKGLELNSKRPALPKKYTKVIGSSKRFYHGRAVTRSANIWNSSKSFKYVMWFALDRYTPLLYSSTSIKGRERDKKWRWDLYEARLRKEQRFLVISKESIEWLIKWYGDIRCEGKTVGRWLREAFPIVRGKLRRESYIESDKKMALCLCRNVKTIGYIAPEIKVLGESGNLHAEAMFCNPTKHLKLKKFSVFTTKKSQLSVEKFLDGKTSTLRPDLTKTFTA